MLFVLHKLALSWSAKYTCLSKILYLHLKYTNIQGRHAKKIKISHKQVLCQHYFTQKSAPIKTKVKSWQKRKRSKRPSKSGKQCQFTQSLLARSYVFASLIQGRWVFQIYLTCHLSRVTCHLSHVTFSSSSSFLILKKLQSGVARWWSVCYQRSLPRLVYQLPSRWLARIFHLSLYLPSTLSRWRRRSNSMSMSRNRNRIKSRSRSRSRSRNRSKSRRRKKSRRSSGS